jgi:hypothetical protein
VVKGSTLKVVFWSYSDNLVLRMLLLYFLMTHQRSVNFIRVAHDWEIDLFTSFFNMLYSLCLRPVERWGGGGGGGL